MRFSTPLQGKPVAQVQNTQAADWFGQDYSSVAAAILHRVTAQPSAPLIIELRVQRAGEELRVIDVNAANQPANQLINGDCTYAY
jgi:hypothetical protein